MPSTCQPLFVGIFAWAVSSAAGADDAAKKRVFSADEILGIRWVTSPAVSPDGKTLAYVVFEWDSAGTKKAERQTTLWLAPTNGAKPPRLVAQKHKRVARPQWSPDGETLAFLSPEEGKAGKNQVFLLAKDGASATCLTESVEGVQSFQWSPNGKAIAFTAQTQSKDVQPGRDDPLGNRRIIAHLWVVDVATRKTEHVPQWEHVVDFCWAPDNKRFAAVTAPTSDPDDLAEKKSLVILDRQDGRVIQTLSTNVGGGLNMAWSPDGKTIAFPESTTKKIARRLALISPAGGKCRYLLDDYLGYPLDPIEWCADCRHLRVRTFEKTRVQLLRVDAGNGDFQRLADQVQNFWSFSASRDGHTIVLTAETGQAPPNVVVLKDGGRPRPLTDMNPQLAGLQLGDVKEVQWKNKKDGQVIYGVLVTPPGYKVGKPCPTVVELHGGPQGMWWSGWLGTYLSRGQYLATHGYAVFLPNPRGSINYGVRFVEANFRDWGGGDLQDVLDGIDYLVHEKIADPDRLAIGGTSYGGYLTAWVTTQTNRFRAAVVDCGWTDLVTWNLSNDVAQPLRRYLGGDEIRDRPFYLSRSPLTFIDRCKTPTLVLHGVKDQRVPLAQGRTWYRGLKLLGVEAEMIVYPREGHGIVERSHQLDVMRRVLCWYDKHVKRTE